MRTKITASNSFHQTEANFYLRADGTVPPAVERRVRRALCPYDDCKCSGYFGARAGEWAPQGHVPAFVDQDGTEYEMINFHDFHLGVWRIHFCRSQTRRSETMTRSELATELRIASKRLPHSEWLDRVASAFEINEPIAASASDYEYAFDDLHLLKLRTLAEELIRHSPYHDVGPNDDLGTAKY